MLTNIHNFRLRNMTQKYLCALLRYTENPGLLPQFVKFWSLLHNKNFIRNLYFYTNGALCNTINSAPFTTPADATAWQINPSEKVVY